jgi:hypothetical protein
MDKTICAKSHHAKFFLLVKCTRSIIPKRIPLEDNEFGRHYFHTMGVIENYKSCSHVDGDSLFFVISWFE